MWQTKYASAAPKNLGWGLNFRPCSEGDFLTGSPQSVFVNEIIFENELQFVSVKPITTKNVPLNYYC
jgi:hypothetical protein